MHAHGQVLEANTAVCNVVDGHVLEENKIRKWAHRACPAWVLAVIWESGD
jgi:hypothetical protein